MLSLFLSTMLVLTQPEQEPPADEAGAAPAAATEADPDPEICRSRLVRSTRLGERNRRVVTCKPRSEWMSDNRSRMRR